MHNQSLTSSDLALAMRVHSTRGTAPTITNQPKSMNVEIGTVTRLTVGVSGTGPFGYTWFRGTNVIAGATGTSIISPPTRPTGLPTRCA